MVANEQPSNKMPGALNPAANLQGPRAKRRKFVVAFRTMGGVKPRTQLAHLFAMLEAPNDQGLDFQFMGHD
jgi:hypothetical protein